MKNTIIMQILKRLKEASPEFYKKLRKYCFWLAILLSIVVGCNWFFGFHLETIVFLSTNLLAVITKILVFLGTGFGFTFIPVKTDMLSKVEGVVQGSFVKIKNTGKTVKVADVKDEIITLTNGAVEHLSNVKSIKVGRVKVKFKK